MPGFQARHRHSPRRLAMDSAHTVPTLGAREAAPPDEGRISGHGGPEESGWSRRAAAHVPLASAASGHAGIRASGHAGIRAHCALVLPGDAPRSVPEAAEKRFRRRVGIAGVCRPRGRAGPANNHPEKPNEQSETPPSCTWPRRRPREPGSSDGAARSRGAFSGARCVPGAGVLLGARYGLARQYRFVVARRGPCSAGGRGSRGVPRAGSGGGLSASVPLFRRRGVSSRHRGQMGARPERAGRPGLRRASRPPRLPLRIPRSPALVSRRSHQPPSAAVIRMCWERHSAHPFPTRRG